jgi:tetrahydromethanopterin S-methyltransferase subunit B
MYVKASLYQAAQDRIADLEATIRDLNEALDATCRELNNPDARIARLEEERDAAVRAEIARGIEVQEAREHVEKLKAINTALVEAMEKCLAWLSNANAYEPVDVLATMFREMLNAGYDFGKLDEIAVGMIHGAASQMCAEHVPDPRGCRE